MAFQTAWLRLLCDIYLLSTVRCPQNVPPPLSFSVPSLLVFLPFLLSFFVRICPSISVPVPVLAMCRLTDGPLFAVLSYLSGGGGDVFGVAVALLPVVKQRAGSVAGHALAKVARQSV